MEVSPARRHPASQQGGRGENQVGGAWGRLEAGGYQQSFYFHTNNVKVKVFTSFHQISEDLCAVDWRAWPMYQFSAGFEGTRWTKWKWKFYHHIFTCLLTFSLNISAWYGLEDESTRDDSINSNLQAFYCSQRTSYKHHNKPAKIQYTKYNSPLWGPRFLLAY